MRNEDKSELEKKVLEGVYGEPELKKEEKNRYLGQFKERVIDYLTDDEINKEESYNKIEEAVKSPQADKVIINRDVDMNYAQSYIKLARNNDLKFKRIDSPDLKGDIVLVVASDRALSSGKRD